MQLYKMSKMLEAEQDKENINRLQQAEFNDNTQAQVYR
jgi:hypothetical protein